MNPEAYSSSQPSKKLKISEERSISIHPESNFTSPMKNISTPPLFLSPSTSKNQLLEISTLSESKKKGISWSAKEDELLKNAVEQHSGKNWKEISKLVPGRTSSQCSQRWRRIQPYKNRQPWSKDEDKLLAELTQKFGFNWSLISSIIEGRTGKQVRERYINKLDPKIDRNKFREEEDLKILELYKKLGPKWREISKSFSGRPENMIKNRFYSYIKKKYSSLGDLDMKLSCKNEEEKNEDEEEEEEEKKEENLEKTEKKTMRQAKKELHKNEEKMIKAESEEIQQRFSLLPKPSDEENNEILAKDKKEKEKKEDHHHLASLFLKQEKELSTEYTFNLENLQPDSGKIKLENQFVNNMGTKFLLPSEEPEFDLFFQDKNKENPFALNEFHNNQPLFNFEDNSHNYNSEKMERLSYLNKRKEVIQSLLNKVMNKIQEYEYKNESNSENK